MLVKDRNVHGTIKFMGQTQFAAGKWIGVELDEPHGKNNGTVSGRTYFLCDDNYGIFVRQNQVDILTGHDTYEPPKELFIPPMPKSPPPSSPHPTVTPLRERSRTTLTTPKSFIPGGKNPAVSPASSPRPKRRVLPPKLSNPRLGELGESCNLPANSHLFYGK